MKSLKYIYIVLPVLFAAISSTSCQEQNGAEYIYPEYSSYSLSSSGDSISILVRSNVDWKVEKDAGWLFAEKTVAGDGETGLSVVVPENSQIEPRTATVILSAGTVVSEITISQGGMKFSGLFEDLAEFPLTYGCAASQNVRYLLGVKDADAEGYCIAEIINTANGERRELEASEEYDHAVAISDQGDDYILQSRKYGTYQVYIDNVITELAVPEGYKNTGISLQGISGDGRVIVGALNSEVNGTGRYPCKWVDGVCEILERPEFSAHGTPTAPYGTLARDCSADGTVIYGTEWTNNSFALAFWRDGKLFYPGGDYAEMNGNTADRIAKTAEYGALSSNGKYLAARYETVDKKSYPVIIDTDTYDVKILKDVSSDMSGATCSNEGLLFAYSPAMQSTQGHVIDPVSGTCMTTAEWFKSEYGLNLSDGRMVGKVSDDGKVFFGTQSRMTVLGVQYSFWYLNMESR